MQIVDELVFQATTEIEGASTTSELKEVEARYLGKNGALKGLFRQMGSLSADEKPKFGDAINRATQTLQGQIDARGEGLKRREREAQFERERIDVTMPGRPQRMGQEHILSMTIGKICRVLGGLGFAYAESPELEQFKYNFDALNYPPDHPAMDDQDTFYIDDEWLLRTQCTSLQGHIFENIKPPLRFFTVGRTFRNEAVDRTHMHTFHQVDCFMIDEHVSMAHLKGTLGAFARSMFGDDATVRFRPDFFPFVEPGVDYAISTKKFGGGRWLELGGAGLIHPNILEQFGIDTERYSGFAFGLGVERIPMLAYGVDDLRHFLENDLRFLRQFRAM